MIHILKFKDFSRINESLRIEKIDPSYYNDETVTSLPYSKYIKDNRNDFLKKLVRISEDLGIHPLWVLHTIFHESKFDPKKSDKYTGSVGLISFFPEVLKNFISEETGKSISPKEVLQMSNVDQLDLINGFYKNWIESIDLESPIKPGDFAALTFYPIVIKKDPDWEFPQYVIEKNPDLFKAFPNPGGKTKKDYYDYIDQLFRNEDEFEDNNKKILGDFTGCFVDPSLFRNKKPLEYYKDLILTKEDPMMGLQIQSQDSEVTQKNKQVENK